MDRRPNESWPLDVGHGSVRELALKASNASAKSLAISAAAAPFNARGIASNPSFKLARKAGDENIGLTIHAHEVEPGSWIAEPAWICRLASVPLDMTPLRRGSRRFKTKSEAVEDAMNRAIVMLSSQSHRQLKSAA